MQVKRATESRMEGRAVELTGFVRTEGKIVNESGSTTPFVSVARKAAKGAAAGIAGAAMLVGAGCATMGGAGQQTGTILGGVIGGVVGNNIGQGYGREAAIITGTLVGAYIGGSIGRTMDQQDRMNAQMALEKNPNNMQSAWVNPNNGNSYVVTPTKTIVTNSGQPCRQYVTTATIGGKAETITGEACRQPDGTWKQVAN